MMKANDRDFLVSMEGVRKSFSGVHALRGVDLHLEKGSIHALLGENGAGKSTLMKILSGIYTPDEGTVMVDSRQVTSFDVKDQLRLGISMIHQELSYVPEMTVAENLFLGNETAVSRFGVVNDKDLNEAAAAMLEKLGIDLDPTVKMGRLRVSQQQLVEIAKAVALEASVLVMDEPTSSLSPKEVKTLFSIISDLKESGTSIIYISHKLEEVFEICDAYTVLRDGQFIGAGRIEEIDTQRLIAMMVGRELADIFPGAGEKEVGETVLEVSRLTSEGVFEDVSFTVGKGEIVGLAGLIGAGRTELSRAIFGLDPYDSGEVRLLGRPLPEKSPKASLAHGIGYVSEDRKTQGLVMKLNLRENVSLANLKGFARAGVLSSAKERNAIEKSVRDLNIKTPSVEAMVRNLSGGNQQKAVLAKALLRQPNLLILDEPTRGIDVGAKSEIYELINSLAREGAGILMISSELPEILGLSDRILVMHEGKLAGRIEKEEATEEKVLALAFGRSEA